MKNVKDILKKWDVEYHENGTPSVPDAVYDTMKEKASYSSVGAPVSGDKVKLPFVLGSLKKVDDVEKWFNDNKGPYLISSKLDGISIMLTFKKGELIFASRRGDGYYGKNITEKIKKIQPTLERKVNLSVRGEAIITSDKNPKDYGVSNRRNWAAGILNRIDDEGIENIKLVFYEILDCEQELNTETERFCFMNDLGLETPYWGIYEALPVTMLKGMLESHKKVVPFDMDGLVIAVNESEREDVLIPENKIAFKVNDDPIQVKVKDVIWETSRTGRVIPVVEIEPTEIGGVIVKRATGHNASFIKDFFVCKGAIVDIVRSGDVIPYIVDVKSESGEYCVPFNCPSCENPLEWKGVDLVCNNKECSTRSYKALEHFLVNMGAENITEKTLRKLELDSLEKIYDADVLDIIDREGFGQKRADKIIKEINKTLNTTPSNLLTAFGISGVGREMSNLILSKYNFDDIFSLSRSDFESIKGIGEKISFNLTVSELPRCKETYDFLKERGLVFVETTTNASLKGKKITLTGKGPIGREVIIQKIVDAGGVVKGISKSTDYLVTDDVDSFSSKTKKAKEYGIEILTYEELFDIIS